MQTSIATVKRVEKSVEKGTSLQFSADGGDFWAYPDRGLNTMSVAVGQVLEIEWFKKPNKTGTSSYTILKSFKPVAPSGSLVQAATPLSPAPVYTKPPQQTGLNGVSEPGLRFISNVVGNALAAKTITVPEELKVWTLAAFNAFKSIDDPSV